MSFSFQIRLYINRNCANINHPTNWFTVENCVVRLQTVTQLQIVSGYSIIDFINKLSIIFGLFTTAQPTVRVRQNMGKSTGTGPVLPTSITFFGAHSKCYHHIMTCSYCHFNLSVHFSSIIDLSLSSSSNKHFSHKMHNSPPAHIQNDSICNRNPIS